MWMAILNRTIWCLKVFALPFVVLFTIVMIIPLMIRGEREAVDELFRLWTSLERDVNGEDGSADRPS